ncbi:Aste57867_24253 [Aphanomyces stellatus]|uniref:Aste57867_24253 protein n=1 Tax=Aphanomyces stellatus TaxID=120398 RepID=A0A485LR17_9STRA|nr:hypothetical protein As57867_024178 [Aphanomyces stellatus]VFU00893.1 Aste57867_24253 [Aphanomyces stellatus]
MLPDAAAAPEVRAVRWDKALKQFVPSVSPSIDAEVAIANLPRVAAPPPSTIDYVGTVEVVAMSERQVQEFFSREVFREDYIDNVASSELYGTLCQGIHFSYDVKVVARHRTAVDLFLSCYDVFLAIAVRSQPALASEYLRCGRMRLFLGQFEAARTCARASAGDGDDGAKKLIQEARQCEAAIAQTKKRSQLATQAPPPVWKAMVADMDRVLAVAPLSTDALHLKTALLLSVAAYADLVVFLTSLPPPLLDIHVTIAYARALDYSGHAQHALDELRKVPPPLPPAARQELLRIQQMQDKRAHAVALARGGHHNLAIDAFRACLALDDHHKKFNANVLYDRAETWLASGEPKEAIRDLETCLELNPTHALAPARLHAARVQQDTSRMQHQLYKEQRAHDKHLRCVICHRPAREKCDAGKGRTCVFSSAWEARVQT